MELNNFSKCDTGRIIRTLQGDIYHLNTALKGTRSKISNEVYNKINIKNIINGYLTDEYIQYNYNKKLFYNIVKCIFWSCINGINEVFKYIIDKLKTIYKNKNIHLIFEKIGLIDKSKLTSCIEILDHACYGQNIDIIEYIIDNMYNGRLNSYYSKLMLNIACCNNNIKILEYILDIKNLDINYDYNIIHIPCRCNNTELLKYLMDKGADINIQNCEGNTPLHIACEFNNKKMVEYLIDKGADINIPNLNGLTPLFIACKYSSDDDIEVVKYLVDKGSNVNFRCMDAMTPIYTACIFNKIEILKYLINVGAEVDIFDIYKRTILHISCQFKNMDIVRYLIENKLIDMNVKDKFGYSCLYDACVNYQIELAKYLIDKGADINFNFIDIQRKSNLNYAELQEIRSILNLK